MRKAKKKEAKLRITLVKSTIGAPKDQKITARTLGLRKLQKTVIHADRPEIRGMVRKIAHLVAVEQVNSE